MTWFHAGREFIQDDAGDYVGFVYVIERLDTGRKYIGQKKLVSRRSRPPLKGRRNKRRYVAPSDWPDYYGSNEELAADVARIGPAGFRRDIVRLCRSKSEMNYFEMREQVVNDVLLYPRRWYNSFVGGKIHRKHLTNFHQES